MSVSSTKFIKPLSFIFFTIILLIPFFEALAQENSIDADSDGISDAIECPAM
jgi:hypothetical protein